MSAPLIGEIRAFGFDYAPPGWALCNGQLLPIKEHQALFAILRTTFGGNGTTTFGLPDLQGRAPMSWGAGHDLTPRSLGEFGGATTVALTVDETPSHTHSFNASGDLATERQPSGQALAQGDGISAFGEPQSATAMFPFAIALSGQGQQHNNLMPFLTLSFCIALEGDAPAST